MQPDRRIIELLERLLRTEETVVHELRQIKHRLDRPTPTLISFQEITMLDATAGNTLVYTGALSPSGSAFPAGTTFSVTSSDPSVSPTVDATGLVVTIPLPATFVDDPANPLTISYTTSSFTPSPADAPSQLSTSITPTVPTPAPPPTETLTPTGIMFAQTT